MPQCEGKTRYTKEKADKVVKKINSPFVQAYPCPICRKWWHVGRILGFGKQGLPPVGWERGDPAPETKSSYHRTRPKRRVKHQKNKNGKGRQNG